MSTIDEGALRRAGRPEAPALDARGPASIMAARRVASLRGWAEHVVILDPRDVITATFRRRADAWQVARWSMTARQKFGRGFALQLLDMARFGLGSCGVHPAEYFLFRLYERTRRQSARNTPFVGEFKAKRLARRLNYAQAGIMATDKLLTSGYLAGLGYPTPRVIAIAHPLRRYGSLPALRGRQDVVRFLRSDARFPLFGKPLAMMNGVGTASIQAYRPSDDTLQLGGGRHVATEAFAEFVSNRFLGFGGYMFQEHLRPHPALVGAVGDRVCTVRIYAILAAGDVELFGAMWRVASGAAMADNYQIAGNLLGAVDLKEGTVLRVLKGSGPDEVDVETHPDTGVCLPGLRLPDWEQSKALIRDVARAFPLLRYQAWDLAHTPEGPMLVEVNAAGGMSLIQRAMGRGIMDDRFSTALLAAGPQGNRSSSRRSRG